MQRCRPDNYIQGGHRHRRRRLRRYKDMRGPGEWHAVCACDGTKPYYLRVVLDAPTKQVVQSLARYWCDNPFACDTPEGMRQWWLMPIDDVSIEQVNRALAWLCDRGFVEQLFAADGRMRFRRASSHDVAALRQLAESG